MSPTNILRAEKLHEDLMAFYKEHGPVFVPWLQRRLDELSEAELERLQDLMSEYRIAASSMGL